MPHREHSVETIRRNSEVMGSLRKLMAVNRGVSIYILSFFVSIAFQTCHDLLPHMDGPK